YTTLFRSLTRYSANVVLPVARGPANAIRIGTPIKTAPSTLSPIAPARLVAIRCRPAASHRPAVAGHSRPGHPLPSRRLWRLRVGRWGRRFWGGQLAHAGYNH